MKIGLSEKLNKSLVIVAIVAVAIVAAVFASNGTFAEFTSSNRAKRVVAAYADEGQLFSSNYMLAVASEDARYYEKNIQLDKVTDEGKNVNITVCNYPQSNSEHFSSVDIVYTINADIVRVSGSTAIWVSSYSDYISSAGVDYVSPFPQEPVTLTGATASKDTYQIYMPKSLITDNLYVRITAGAVGFSDIQRLLCLSYPSTDTEIEWDIDCDVDDKSKSVSDYSGFNVRLFGTGAGTINLTWTAPIEISDVFCRQVAASAIQNGISFHVSGDVDSYDIQFYPNTKGAVSTWDYISKSYIRVSFIKD